MTVVESLWNKMETIEGNIAIEEKTNKLLSDFTLSKKEELSEITKRNLKFSYEIEDLSEKLQILKSTWKGDKSSLFLTEASHIGKNLKGSISTKNNQSTLQKPTVDFTKIDQD